MSINLSSVLAPLSSNGVPSVTGTNIQVRSLQGCIPGLAGPEPSGTFIHPGQPFHGSRGYLNTDPVGPLPPLAPPGLPVNTVGPQEVPISLLLCCATGALRDCPAQPQSVPGDQESPAAEAIITKIAVGINCRMAEINQPMPLAELLRSLEAPPSPTLRIWKALRST